MGQKRQQASITEVKKKQQVKIHRAYDYSLLFLTIFLVCFGLVMIYSTSSYNAMKYYIRAKTC